MRTIHYCTNTTCSHWLINQPDANSCKFCYQDTKESKVSHMSLITRHLHKGHQLSFFGAELDYSVFSLRTNQELSVSDVKELDIVHRLKNYLKIDDIKLDICLDL